MNEPLYILDLDNWDMVPSGTKAPLPPFLQDFVRKYPAWALALDPDRKHVERPRMVHGTITFNPPLRGNLDA